MFHQLTVGDAGPEVDELQQRLVDLGFEVNEPRDRFDEVTRISVEQFQRSRGLDASGVCDSATWRALLEAEHQFGSRPLYLASPMLRGDDVATLQLRLGSLGFNAGRVDGIFGPNTQRAVRDFQQNVDLVVDGVCARDTVSQLDRLTSRGGGHSVAGMREREDLDVRATALGGLRVAICHRGVDNALVGALGADLHLAEAVVSVASDDDWSALAAATNAFEADVCLAVDVVDAVGVEIAYYSTDGFQSEAGRMLAESLLRQLPHPPGWPPSVARGMRLPILRETRCPTVRIKIGPIDDVAEIHSLLVAAGHRALRAWTDRATLNS